MLPSYISEKFQFLLRIPFFNRYIIKLEKRNARNFLRGYNFVKNSYGLEFINNLLIDLSLCSINNTDVPRDSFLKNTDFKLDISLRQYTVAKIILSKNTTFNKSLFISIYKKTPLIYSLPSTYINLLSSRGIKVARMRSLILWRFVLILEFTQSVISSIKYIIENLFYLISTPLNYGPRNRKVDAYFLGLIENKIPSSFQSDSPYDCFTYFGKKYKSGFSVVFAHDVQIKERKLNKQITLKYQKYPFKFLTKSKNLLKVISFLIKEVISAPFYFFSKKWWRLFVLKDLVFAMVCYLQIDKELSKSYLFHNSFIYRPIWSYVADAKGSEIIFYFYSINNETFLNKDGNSSSPNYVWQNMNWPKYLFWNKYSENYYIQFCRKPFRSEISGPINLNHIRLDKSLLVKEPSISIFDVMPIRVSSFRSLAPPFEYYIPEVAISFLKDILLVCEKNNIQILLKNKYSYNRNKPLYLHPKYINFLSKFSNHKNVILIKPDTSPVDLIKATRLSIVMPFTSVAFISKSVNKPVCFYDSSGRISKRDLSANGIDIVIGYNELNNWVLTKINS